MGDCWRLRSEFDTVGCSNIRQQVGRFSEGVFRPCRLIAQHLLRFICCCGIPLPCHSSLCGVERRFLSVKKIACLLLVGAERFNKTHAHRPQGGAVKRANNISSCDAARSMGSARYLEPRSSGESRGAILKQSASSLSSIMLTELLVDFTVAWL